MASEKLYELQQKFQREINRISDSDRNTRKRGLQKLVESLPWTSEDDTDALRTLCSQTLFVPVLQGVSDPVEKCREYSISLLTKTVALCAPFNNQQAAQLINALCARVNDIPFPETGEEIRLQVLDLLSLVLSHPVATDLLELCGPAVLLAMTKALQDSFPAVKRTCCDIIILFCIHTPNVVHAHFKNLTKYLCVNALHQHHKVRSVSLTALKGVILVVAGGQTSEKTYLTSLQEDVLPLFTKVVGDRSANPRREASEFCGAVIKHRIACSCWFDSSTAVGGSGSGGAFGGGRDGSGVGSVEAPPQAVDVDTELLSVLFILMGDDDDTVRKTSMKELVGICQLWHEFSQNKANSDSMEEETVRPSVEDAGMFVLQYAPFVLEALDRGIAGGWRTEVRLRFLGALNALIVAIEYLCDATHSAALLTGDMLPLTLQALSSVISDEDVSIRQMAQKCTSSLGRVAAAGDEVLHVVDTESKMSSGSKMLISAVDTPLETVCNYLVPRVRGEVAGMDTASHRTSAMLLLCQIMSGAADGVPSVVDSTEEREVVKLVQSCVHAIASALASPALYDFREVSLRESALLLLRTLILTFPTICTESFECEEHLCIALIYLSGRCSHEDNIIPNAAKKEINRLVEMSKHASAASLIGAHFKPILLVVTSAISVSSSSSAISHDVAASPVLRWGTDNANCAAFDALIRLCNKHAWAESDIVLDGVIIPLVQPKVQPAKGSVEEVAQSYAAVRGDVDESWGEIDVRLAMLALLESMLRAGGLDWECGKFMSENCNKLLERALVPNLVWRAGRVEGVARKVALTATHDLLKAGGVKPEALYKFAPNLVPLLASDLDDSDASARHIGCLCLGIIFERLRGGFGEQAVHELYPKLLKRLDDSEDSIRVTICQTLRMFLKCAAPECYRGTTIDYTLDQLFIHLDDPDPKIQKEVFDVIIDAAVSIDAALVLKKAESNKLTHRNPVMCEAVITAVHKFR